MEYPSTNIPIPHTLKGVADSEVLLIGVAFIEIDGRFLRVIAMLGASVEACLPNCAMEVGVSVVERREASAEAFGATEDLFKLVACVLPDGV